MLEGVFGVSHPHNTVAKNMKACSVEIVGRETVYHFILPKDHPLADYSGCIDHNPKLFVFRELTQ